MRPTQKDLINHYYGKHKVTDLIVTNWDEVFGDTITPPVHKYQATDNKHMVVTRQKQFTR